jgi:hypothetical protein
MKKIIMLFFAVCSSTMVYSQLKVMNNGKVGIGMNSPAYQLDVKNSMRFRTWTGVIFDGTGLCTSPVIYPENDWYLQLGKDGSELGNMFIKVIHTQYLYYDSDSLFKEGIQPIGNPMSKLRQVKGYKYFFSDSLMNTFPESERAKYNVLQYGFIGQELNKVFPELTLRSKENKSYQVNYNGFIPLLLEAIKCQDSIITELETRIRILENGMSYMPSFDKSSLSETLNYKSSSSITGENNFFITNAHFMGYLEQNHPNPYSQTTVIPYFINIEVDEAILKIYDINGQIKMQIPITNKGKNELTLQANSLESGIYIYSLYCNNIQIDTKIMILTQ